MESLTGELNPWIIPITTVIVGMLGIGASLIIANNSSRIAAATLNNSTAALAQTASKDAFQMLVTEVELMRGKLSDAEKEIQNSKVRLLECEAARETLINQRSLDLIEMEAIKDEIKVLKEKYSNDHT